MAFLGFRKNDHFNPTKFHAKLITTSRSNIADTAAEDRFDYQGYNYVTLPTDATIVKNGECSNYSEANPGEANLWSAVGITDNNRLVILSSSSYVAFTPSDHVTTPYDLCLVFKSQGVKDAIRLDGGSSASLSINGVHVNPLLGINGLATGSTARKILYTLTLD